MQRCLATLVLAAVPLGALAADGVRCSARSGPAAVTVVELYTSEGCSSCPPADRWLSTLVGRKDVVALAFHVDYWDRLGWTDRFGRPEWTRRQYDAAARGHARTVYTPQVLVGGREHRRWPSLPPAGPAPLDLQLAREGAAYVAQVAPGRGAPPALAGYWAVTENGHVSRVRSGENAGATLHHDAVVRELSPVAALQAGVPVRFEPRTAPDAVSGPRPRRVVFVVTDAASGVPVTAVAVDC